VQHRGQLAFAVPARQPEQVDQRRTKQPERHAHASRATAAQGREQQDGEETANGPGEQPGRHPWRSGAVIAAAPGGDGRQGERGKQHGDSPVVLATLRGSGLSD